MAYSSSQTTNTTRDPTPSSSLIHVAPSSPPPRQRAEAKRRAKSTAPRIAWDLLVISAGTAAAERWRVSSPNLLPGTGRRPQRCHRSPPCAGHRIPIPTPRWTPPLIPPVSSPTQATRTSNNFTTRAAVSF